MKSESPLFTVIIPCKNRASYLHHTLRTCMMQNYDNMEVLVSDDGSTDNTREVVEEASRLDSRIHYLMPGSGTGMSHNFEYVLRHVKPGYVIALGGDDGLMPDGIKGMHDTLQETGMELLAWPAPTYIFPDVNGPDGQLSIRCFKGTKIIDSHQYLSRQAKNLHYISDFESPMFYVKGVASTKLIDRVRNRSVDGSFYSCSTPDGYSGIVLAGEVSHYAFSGKPFSIYGSSSDSQGIVYMSNDEKAKKASEIFFDNVLSRPMHRELASQPYSPLITLMTVDFLLTARDLPGWSGSFPPINYRQALLSGIKELKNGLYGDERIRRELSIMNEIAKQQGLQSFFRREVKRSKRFQKRPNFEGNGIYPGAFFVNSKSYNINNIFDAAYAAQHLHQAYADLNISSLFEIVFNSIKYRFRSMKKGYPFPPESEWHNKIS
jgi:glycosyltransferase involved in cell wall biosynthesis